MFDKKETSSLIDMQKDIITHPPTDLDYLSDLFDSPIFTQAEIEDINNALKIILSSEDLTDSKRRDFVENLWKINYIRKPPTPEEFLTEEWIGDVSNEAYPYIKDYFCNFFDPAKPYRNLVAALFIGGGKSFLSSLASTYEATLLYYLRNPKQFFKLSQMSHLVAVCVSLTQDMAYDLCIKPQIGLLQSSPKFERIRTEDIFMRRMKEDKSKIYYTTASKGNAILRIGDLSYNVISEPRQLLGLTICFGSLTEITFMQEQGMSEDTIMRLLNDLKRRIHSRLGDTNYFARTIIDSSPNTMESRIDQYIFNECQNDPSVLRLTGKKWEYQPWLFPVYEKTKEVFSIFTGSLSKAARLIDKDKEDMSSLDLSKVIDVPIDAYNIANNDLSRFIRDYAGLPSSIEDKLITNYDTIESLFTPALKNFYIYKHAPTSMPPETLLWNIIKSELFTYTGQGQQYEFYRYPKAERFLSFDLAKNHDMATASMCHVERNLKGEKVYIIDFSLAVMSTKEEINIDSFKWLALDLVRYGSILLKKVSFDGYQSDSSRQFLLRYGMDAIRQSVDSSLEPYMSFISYMNQGRVLMGRNLIMKNNLKSLILQKSDRTGKMKVEHEKGEWVDLQNNDWKTSRMGYYGKDLSDSVVSSIALADLYGTENADYIWDERKEQVDKKSIISIEQELSKNYNLRIKV